MERSFPDMSQWENDFRSTDSTAARVALGALLTQFHGILEADCRRLCGGRQDDADELFQNAMVLLLSRRTAFDPQKGKWLPWARRVLSGVASDVRKRAATERKHRDFHAESLLETAPAIEELPAAEIGEFRRQATRCLYAAGITELERKAFILRVLGGHSWEMTARIMSQLQNDVVTAQQPSEVTISMVRTCCANVRSKLRDCLSGYGP
ncbi:MAG: RNA polymerase sigma factor [Planctomycetota bacterium]|nr:RNA polymerase sigma factor [Planctomycetota bacterium]